MHLTHYGRLLLAGTVLLLMSFRSQAGTVTAISSGSWNSMATWLGGAVPGNADDVVIGANYSVTLAADVSIKSLTVSGSLDASTYVITAAASGFFTINGTLRTANSNGLISGTSGTLSTGNSPLVTLGSSSTIEYYGSGYQVITVRDYANLVISGARGGQWLSIGSGTIGISGTFTHSATNVNYNNSATVNYKGSNQTIAVFPYEGLSLAGATNASFPSGTVTISDLFIPGTLTGTNTGTINFNGRGQTVPAFLYNNLDLSNASQLSFATPGIIGVRGTFTRGYVSSATTGSTIRFNGSNQTVPVFGYYNLDLTGATGTSFATTNYPGIDIYGSFTPDAITRATTGSYFNFKGAAGQALPAFNYYNLDLDNGSHSFPSGTIGIAGALSNSRNNTPTQGTIAFNGSNQSLQSSFNFYNLDISAASNIAFTNYTVGIAGSFITGSTTSAGSNYTVSFTGSNQTVPAFQYYNLNLAGATGISFANGTIRIGGSFSPGSITTISQGTISYTGSSPSIQPLTYYGLDISAPGAVWMSAGGAVTINGPFSVGSSTQLNLSSWTATTFNIAGSLAWNASGGQSLQFLTVNLLGSGTLSNSGTGYTPNVVIASAASYTLTGNFSGTTGSTLTVNGSLNMAGYQLGGAGSILVNSAGTIKVGYASGLSGSLANSGGYVFASGVRYEFNGTVAQSTGFSGVTIGTPASVTISNSSADVTLDGDLTLGTGGQFIVASGGRCNAGTRGITLGSGGSVTINGTFRTASTAGFSGGTSTSIRSSNNPTISIGSGSSIDYSASSAQVVTARSDYQHLALSNGQKTLGGATTLAGNITLSGGSRLLLGGNSLSIGGTMSGDASNFVVTSGGGSVVLRGIGSGGKQFVIGASSSSYSPLTIAQASGLDWTVQVAASISPTLATSSESIQRMWTITPSTNPVPSGATLTFQYNEGDAGIQGSSWNPNGNVTLKRYNGAAWVTPTGNIAPTGSAGGIRTATAAGITQFSPWVVTTGGSVLPVQLLRFSGRRQSAANILSWSTAQESENAGFTIERSADGRSFHTLAQVPSRAAGGNSNTQLDYEFSDAAAAGTRYYRLRQQDLGGRARYSPVVKISDTVGLLPPGSLSFNQSADLLRVMLQSASAQRAQLLVADASGRLLLLREQVLGVGSNSVEIGLTGLAPGLYFVELVFEDGSRSAGRFRKL
ncbi:beta strand repeat-containing protein [Flaviaesturariibacter terrae]